MTRIGRDDGYEINFVVQNQAKEASMMLSQKLLCICHELGANINTIENTVKRLNREKKENNSKLKRLTNEYLAKVKHRELDGSGNVNLIHAVLSELDYSEIRSFAGKMVSSFDKRTIILIAHIPDNYKEDALIIFARSQPLDEIDCNRLFQAYSYLGAKGGGKSSFITGVIGKRNVNHLIEKLIADLRVLLRDKPA
jgi:alanyl-tRNA synthetase